MKTIEINKVNSKGKREGYWEENETFEDGVRVESSKGIYVNGVKQGYWEETITEIDEYDETSTTLERGIYVNGKREGYWELLENGELSDKGSYEYGRKEGYWTEDFGVSHGRYSKGEREFWVNGRIWTN